MTKLMLWIIALVALSGGSLLAQSITGNWLGTLQVSEELRVVIKISTADEGGLKAVLYSIDQRPRGIPASAVTLQGSTVKISVAGGTYEGKLNADGASITGTWTQEGARPLPLNLKRATSAPARPIPTPARRQR